MFVKKIEARRSSVVADALEIATRETVRERAMRPTDPYIQFPMSESAVSMVTDLQRIPATGGFTPS